MSHPRPETTVDERGRRCPAPIIALGRTAAERPGQLVELLADDPAARHDVPAWCRMRGADLLTSEQVTSPDGAQWARYVVLLPPAKAPGTAPSSGTSRA